MVPIAVEKRVRMDMLKAGFDEGTRQDGQSIKPVMGVGGGIGRGDGGYPRVEKPGEPPLEGKNTLEERK